MRRCARRGVDPTFMDRGSARSERRTFQTSARAKARSRRRVPCRLTIEMTSHVRPPSIMDSGLAGIHRAHDKLAVSAAQVTRGAMQLSAARIDISPEAAALARGGPEGDIAEGMVGQVVAKVAQAASVAVVKTGAEVSEELLKIVG